MPQPSKMVLVVTFQLTNNNTDDKSSAVCKLIAHIWETNWPDGLREGCWSVETNYCDVILVCDRVVVLVELHGGDRERLIARLSGLTEVVLAELHQDLLLSEGLEAVSSSEDVCGGDEGGPAVLAGAGASLPHQGRQPRPLVWVCRPAAHYPGAEPLGIHSAL